MAKKVTNFSDLIQRVTANCLLHPLGSNRFHEVDMTPDRNFHPKITHQQLKSTLSNPQDEYNDEHYNSSPSSSSEEDEQDIYEDARETEEELQSKRYNASKAILGREERENDIWVIMGQVFDSVSALKKAYADLQEAHSPWDPEKMRVADAAVVAELRRMGVLRERFKRGGERKAPAMKAAETVAEVVAPYEAAVEELKGSGVVMVKEMGVPSSPTPDMFEATMKQVRETSKSFTSCLLSLMRAAQWDLSAAVRSIEAAISTTGSTTIMTSTNPHQHQTKHALESYVLRKIFQGFDHETFYMDGTLYSLLNPSQFRSECFSKYRDMKSMDPSELLGILPSSPFGVFCSKKYQEIVHPKMEESLFGNLDQRNQLLNGSHPRTQFYTEFLGLAKAVWLLHLLAFSLNPPPSHFEASRGAEFHSGYMESVVRYPGGKVPPGQIVGFPVSPGFKLGNGSVFKARVYLVPRK
ncbi:Protein GRAVITROPIC IN THE LIGHT 1 [Bienertia sinuspersici]